MEKGSKKQKLTEKLNFLRNQFDLLKYYNFDIVRVAKENNIIVGNSKLSDEDGFLIICNEDDTHYALIGVNNKYPLFQKRYIIAYSLGLYSLIRDKKGYYINKIKLDENIDLEIDKFAKSLLVPIESFYSTYQNMKKDFDVSEGIDDLLSDLYKVPLNIIKSKEKEADVISKKLVRKKEK